MPITDPRTILLKRVAAAGTQKACAAELGIAQSYLNDLLSGRRTFSDRVLDKLGLARTIVTKRRAS